MDSVHDECSTFLNVEALNIERIVDMGGYRVREKRVKWNRTVYPGLRLNLFYLRDILKISYVKIHLMLN
jgi:hypothetical protein